MNGQGRRVVMPDLELGDVPLRAGSWLVFCRREVIAGDRLLEIVAGDVLFELPSPVDGILIEQCVVEDQPVLPGQHLATIVPADGVR